MALHRTPSPIPGPVSWADAVKLIKRHDAQLHRLNVPAESLRCEDGYLVAGASRWSLTELGWAQLCRQVSAPPAYLRRLSEDLRGRVLAFHVGRGDHMSRALGHAKGRHHNQVTVVARDGCFRGLARADLQTLRAEDVVERIGAIGEAALGDKFDSFIVHRLDLSDEAFVIDLRNTQVISEPRPQDVVQAGIRVTHHFLNDHPTRVETFLFRLVCENGAVRRECIGDSAWRVRRATAANPQGKEQTLTRLEALAGAVFRGLQPKLNALSTAAAQAFNQHADARRFIDAQLRAIPRLYSRRLSERIQEAWDEEGAEATEYGVWNAFTRVATHTPPRELRPSVRNTLERLSGVLGTRAAHFCPRCFHVLDPS